MGCIQSNQNIKVSRFQKSINQPDTTISFLRQDNCPNSSGINLNTQDRLIISRQLLSQYRLTKKKEYKQASANEL